MSFIEIKVFKSTLNFLMKQIYLKYIDEKRIFEFFRLLLSYVYTLSLESVLFEALILYYQSHFFNNIIFASFEFLLYGDKSEDKHL